MKTILRQPNIGTKLALAALLATGCSSHSTPTAPTATATTISATTGGSGLLSVSSVSPPSGAAIATFPTIVQVSFSETSLDSSGDSSAANYAGNYSITCGTTLVNATSVSFSSGTAMVTFPAQSVAASTSCVLNVSTAIKDSAGNNLTGTNTATWQITTGSSGLLSVSSFSPAAGTVSTLPTSVVLSYSETSLDLSGGLNSEINAANYSVNCNGSVYAVTAASLTSSGVVTLTIPSESIAAGTACTLSAAANLADSAGNKLGVAATATYTVQGGYSATWTESATTTYTSTGGYAGVGAPFWNPAVTGLAMEGLNIRIGSYLDQVTGVWNQAFNTSASAIYGPSYGGIGGSAVSLRCPSGMQMTGIYGSYSTQITSIGILCANQGGTSTYQSAAFGTTGASSFQSTCNTGQFATELLGATGTYVNSLALGCR